MKLVLNGICTDFVSIQVKQDPVAGTIEAAFSKRCLVLGEKCEEQLGTRKCRVPMRHGVDKFLHDLVVTPEAHQAVADFPYRQLIGSLSFPSCHAKLENKTRHQPPVETFMRLGRHMRLRCTRLLSLLCVQSQRRADLEQRN